MDTAYENRWRFDARRQRWSAKPPPQYAGPLFRKTVVLLFVLGCVLEFFR